jgi:uncharacterized protein YecE (DUF72 family)
VPRKLTAKSDATLNLFEISPDAQTEPLASCPPSPSGLRIGTSSFTATGWERAFYPAGLPDADRLSFYATRFNTLEIDSTFYGTPSRTTVRNWYAKTPLDFVFALKVPQLVTHDKVLVDAKPEFDEFIRTAADLGEKLGPLLLQFPYFNSSAFKSQADFFERLKPFLAKLPTDMRFVVEIRNKHWLDERLIDLLRKHGVGLALIDQSFVPRPWELETKLDWVTAQDFVYVRMLGDRKAIETQTKVWDKVIVDRARDLRSWIDYLKPIRHRGETMFVYVNNHWSGFAPATAEQFLRVWNG